jgi:putative transcriptional regulator
MAQPYKSAVQGLNGTTCQEREKTLTRKTRSAIKPVREFDTEAIRRIRRKTGLSQVMFALSLGVSPKTVEAWECGRNRPEGASRRLLEIVQANPAFLQQFYRSEGEA